MVTQAHCTLSAVRHSHLGAAATLCTAIPAATHFDEDSEATQRDEVGEVEKNDSSAQTPLPHHREDERVPQIEDGKALHDHADDVQQEAGHGGHGGGPGVEPHQQRDVADAEHVVKALPSVGTQLAAREQDPKQVRTTTTSILHWKS